MSNDDPEPLCTMPSCDQPADIDHDRGGAGHLCADHQPDTDTEPETEAENEEHESARETPADPDTGDANPGCEAGEPWSDADFAAPESGVWCTDHLARDQWMGGAGEDGKQPFAPWADRDAPASCSKDGHTTADECDCDARFKWGYRANYTDAETIAMAEDDHRLSGRVFIQRADDPLAYIDGDDVLDSETGKVHPAFLAVLDRLGITYADVSQSGGGAHAVYRGELPEGVPEAAWPLDTEPWGDHDEDDLPSIEIYDGKRVLAATGKHVPCTPVEANEWDADALRDVLDENDQLPEPVSEPFEAREEFDGDEYEPTATVSGETTDDMRDLLAALDRLDARRVAGRTIVASWNDDASTSEGKRAFRPTWGAGSNGTANVVDDRIWQDTGDEAGYGGPVVMALIDAGEVRPADATPRVSGALWWKGVERLRELGYDIPEFEGGDGMAGDGDPVAVLPELSPKARAKAVGGHWYDDRSADADGDDTDAGSAISQQEIYDRVRAAEADAMERGDNVVLDGIMGGGKTYNFFGALADRDDAGSYFAPRVELYDQAVEYAKANGFTRDECHILPSISRHCPTWQGEHGEEQQELIKRLHALGVQPRTIHNLLGDELGCKQDESGKCEYEHQWDFDPDEYPVLIGHYSHAHLTHVTSGRHCAFDEDPTNAFTGHIGGDQLTRGVNAFLSLHDSPPFDGWDDLIQHRNNPDRREAGLEWFDRPEFEFEPDERNAVRYEDDGFHALAPLAVYVILAADPLEAPASEDTYPFEQAQLPGLGNTGQFFTTSEQEGEYYVEISTPPALGYTGRKAVIALDGTPLTQEGDPIEWENALDRPMNYRRVLTDGERAEFLSETLGNVYIQSSEYVKPYSSGRYNHPIEDATLLAGIREQYGDGDPATVFTDMAVCEQYEAAGFVEEGLAETFDYPGNLRGSDEYGDCRLGVQLGSSHHGDHEVRRRAAALGETVALAPEGKGIDRDYGTEVGNAIVYQMREAQSAQNALRIGRDGNGALFVFDTCAFPDWFPVENDLASVSRWTDTEHDVREAWSAFDAADRRDGFTTARVTEAVEGTAERQIRSALSRFADAGLLSKERDPGDGRRVLWVDDGLGDLEPATPAEIDFPEIRVDGGAEVAAESRIVVYTRNRRNFAPDAPGERGTDGGTGAASTGADGGGGPPPDTAD